MKITYIVAVKAVDGVVTFGFMDPADTLNFIMDVQDNVESLALTYQEEHEEDFHYMENFN